MGGEALGAQGNPWEGTLGSPKDHMGEEPWGSQWRGTLGNPRDGTLGSPKDPWDGNLGNPIKNTWFYPMTKNDVYQLSNGVK